ncbi:TonB-dependent receptor domain-containing protein [Sphingoaurantiacus capsulatus]|uniref:TonB-dependent receptor domain-containing protein n=1 Tax=Sphingoaurantiacus capsulatus TaxID=1771310 RepID=A0ABV7XCF6_9SPHN
MCSTIVSAMLAVSPAAAFAQETAAADQAEASATSETEETIVVTGSRLVSKNVSSSSPVQTIQDQAFDTLGAVDTVDLVNTLPSVTPDQDTSFANGANGTSTLDLRGLGATRTLVLVNGKRLPPGSPTPGGYASDLNLIPSQLIQRVEIVTGGASAVYGSDAIAGVANFIMKRDFEGLEIDALYGFNQSNNNSAAIQRQLVRAGIEPLSGSTTGNNTYDISAVFGAALGGDRGNVTAYARYLKNDGLNQSERDFSQCALGLFAETEAYCIGAPTGPDPSNFILSPAIPVGGTAANAIPLRGANGAVLLDSAGRPRTSGSFALQQDRSLIEGSNTFNFNPFNPLRRAVERINAGFSGWYNVTDDIEAYLDFGFTKSQSPQIIAPSGGFGSEINRVNCDNPALTSAQRLLICGTASITGPYPRDPDGDGYAQAQLQRRFVEGGPRTDDRTLTNFRVVSGVKGTFAESFKWDVFGQWAETSLDRVQFNQVLKTPLLNALDIVTDPRTNQFACRVTVQGTDPRCVPFTRAYDPTATYDPRLQTYLDAPTLTQGKTSQIMAGGTLQSNLGDFGFVSPLATDGVGLLLGVEHRREELITRPDATAQAGLLLGGSGPLLPADGETKIQEFFLETSIPIVQGKAGFHELAFSGAFRRSDYKSKNNLTGQQGGDFGASTYAFGTTWAPIEPVRLRAQFQRAIRAPNVQELFLPVNTGLSGLTDPCSGFAGSPTPPTRSAADCARSGVLASQYGSVPPAGAQVNVRTGGNPDLEPEVSDTITIGAVIRPPQIRNLSLSVDYFDIKLKGAVATIPASFTLARCLDTAEPEFCSLITRGPDGSLTFRGAEPSFIDATTRNIGGFATSGFDAQINYSHEIGSLGRLLWGYASTYLLSFDTTPVAGAGTTNCVGLYDRQCDTPKFKYRHVVSTTWKTPWNIDIAANWRYQSSVDRIDTINTTTGATVTWKEAGKGAFQGSTLAAQHYADLTAFWNIRENIQVRLGVRNVLDNDPPIVPQFGPSPTFIVEGNTVSGTYEAAGRFIFVGTNVRF